MENIVLNKKKIYELDKIEPLDDVLDIENIILLIKKITNKIDFYKKLKKKRNNDIDEVVSKLEDKVEFYKQIIIITIEKKVEDDTLSFPGTGRVNSRKSKDNFVIKDEEKLFEFLRKEGKFEEFVKISSISSVDKPLINKYIKELDTVEKLPKFITKEKKGKTLTITFEKEIKESSSMDIGDKENVDVNDFDGINI